jgi:SAM-dependent methyltransferase
MRDDRRGARDGRPAGALEPDGATGASEYDRIATLYDPWSHSVVEDVAFYVEEARKAAGRAGVDPAAPVVELGVGTGRIAVPVAAAGISVIGVDRSEGMLDVCRRRAESAGVADRLDLRRGDFRRPPVDERVALVMCPFRAYLHLPDDDTERIAALRAAGDLLVPGGLLAFDVFAPSPDDIEETNGLWIERERGIWERATWDEEARRLTLDVRGPDALTTLGLTWLPTVEWHRLLDAAGFEVEACYGWFDRRPYAGGEDSVWLARRGR